MAQTPLIPHQIIHRSRSRLPRLQPDVVDRANARDRRERGRELGDRLDDVDGAREREKERGGDAADAAGGLADVKPTIGHGGNRGRQQAGQRHSPSSTEEPRDTHPPSFSKHPSISKKKPSTHPAPQSTVLTNGLSSPAASPATTPNFAINALDP